MRFDIRDSRFEILLLLAIPLGVRADLMSAVTSAASALEAEPIEVRTNEIGRAVIEAIARTADPRARVLTSNEWSRLQAERAGVIPSADPATEPARRDSVKSAEEWPEELAYLGLNELMEDAGGVSTSLLSWTSKKGLVLDLRGTGGHGRETAEWMAGFLAATNGPLYSVDGVARGIALTSRWNSAVVALVDSGTSGAAELLAALLAGSAPRAVILGETTSGDFMLREAVPLPSGEFLYYNPSRRIITANGKIYDSRSGVMPDIVVSNAPVSDYEPESDGTDRRARLDEEDEDRKLRARVRGDAALQRAVDILLALKALNLGTADAAEDPAR